MSSTILTPAVALVDALAAVAVLCTLQLALASAVSRWPRARQVVTGEPTLVAHRGRLLHDAMRREHLHEEDVMQALRANSVAGLWDAEAVVLETNGSLSVVPRVDGPAPAVPHARPVTKS